MDPDLFDKTEDMFLRIEEERDTIRAQLKASQADVKLLREALGEVLTSTTKQVGICGALDRAVAALAATAPKE